MLASLHIVNFAIIEDTVIDFSKGVNIFTGETGAGKSILVDALALLMGKRAKADLIRRGADFFRVEGVFLVSSSMAVMLREAGFDVPGDEVIISRKMTETGRGTCTVNGSFCTVKQLELYGKELVRLHEQQDHMELLSSAFCRDMVDGADENIEAVRRAYDESYDKWRSVKRRIEDWERQKQEHERRLDVLQWEIETIRSADLRMGEDNETEQKLSLLRHHEKIVTALRNAVRSVGDDGGGRDCLAEAAREADTAARYDATLSDTAEALHSAVYAAEDALAQMEKYLSDTDFSEEALNRWEERDRVIGSLKRKYGPTLEDVLSYREKAEKESEDLQSKMEESHRWGEEEVALREEASEKARILNECRREKGKFLLEKVKASLRDMGMEHAELSLHLAPSSRLSATAAEEMEIYFSANPGEPLRPLREIASGGEISRISLAVETVSMKESSQKTLIFDEIDVGISGKAAMQVAQNIKKLAQKTQVICVTHLPQTAGIADAHFRIEKRVEGQRTTTVAVPLSEEERLEELARMIAGDGKAEGGLQAAKEMKAYFRTFVDGGDDL